VWLVFITACCDRTEESGLALTLPMASRNPQKTGRMGKGATSIFGELRLYLPHGSNLYRLALINIGD